MRVLWGYRNHNKFFIYKDNYIERYQSILPTLESVLKDIPNEPKPFRTWKAQYIQLLKAPDAEEDEYPHKSRQFKIGKSVIEVVSPHEIASTGNPGWIVETDFDNGCLSINGLPLAKLQHDMPSLEDVESCVYNGSNSYGHPKSYPTTSRSNTGTTSSETSPKSPILLALSLQNLTGSSLLTSLLYTLCSISQSSYRLAMTSASR